MIGREIGSGQRLSLENYVKQNPQCAKYAEYIDKNYLAIAKEKKNIFVGFGFVSHKHGLSEGMPIDIYTMLLTAETMRRKVLAEGAKVHILIGDHFAFTCQHASCQDSEKVRNTRTKYVKKLHNILSNLRVSEHYVFHFSSDVIKDSAFREYRQDLETQAKKIASEFSQIDVEPKFMISRNKKYTISTDTWELLNPGTSHYEPTNRDYFLDQTAIIRYFYEKYDCNLKISWAKAHQSSKIMHSTSFDEPHFDRFYREMYFDHEKKISFVYTKSGYAMNRQDERAKTIPYTAPKDAEVKRVLLTSKQPLLQEGKINGDLMKSVAQNVATIAEIRQEIQTYQAKEGDIEAFYNNATLLRIFGKKPEKHLAITFKNLKMDEKKLPQNGSSSNDAKL